jgi:cytochrome P450
VRPAPLPFRARAVLTPRRRRLAKGDPVIVPILLINRSTELWGADAREWRPARWLQDGGAPAPARDIPGVWGHVPTFLSGPHACIGFKFSLVECVRFPAVRHGAELMRRAGRR